MGYFPCYSKIFPMQLTYQLKALIFYFDMRNDITFWVFFWKTDKTKLDFLNVK